MKNALSYTPPKLRKVFPYSPCQKKEFFRKEEFPTRTVKVMRKTETGLLYRENQVQRWDGMVWRNA